ncbi:ABC-type microcin C transport system permease subunit YejB [Bradyrhizobium diazoefficiens]
MGLVVVALAFSTAITLALYTLSPQRRLQMLTALQRNKWYAAQGFAVVAIGYAIPNYLLLLLASYMR